MKVVLLLSLAGPCLGLAGCGNKSAASSAGDVAAFNGHPDSPEAKVAAQRAAAEGAQKAAAARAQAQQNGVKR